MSAPPSERYRRFLAVYRETSREAYESIGDLLPAIEAQIIRIIAERGGAACFQIEAAAGMKHQTASAAIRHLCEEGVLVDSGVRFRNESGRRCIVWALPVTPGPPAPEPYRPPVGREVRVTGTPEAPRAAAEAPRNEETELTQGTLFGDA